MTEAIEDLPNIGPFLAKRLAEVGVRTAEELRVIGAVEAYARLKFQFGQEVTLNALWGMDAALSGIHWRHLTDERKDKLKRLIAARGNFHS